MAAGSMWMATCRESRRHHRLRSDRIDAFTSRGVRWFDTPGAAARVWRRSRRRPPLECIPGIRRKRIGCVERLEVLPDGPGEVGGARRAALPYASPGIPAERWRVCAHPLPGWTLRGASHPKHRVQVGDLPAFGWERRAVR